MVKTHYLIGIALCMLFISCGGSDGGSDDNDPPPVPDTEAPSTPANLVASNTTVSSVDLAWDTATDNVEVSGYIVYRDDNELATVTQTQYQATNLMPSTVYTFNVAATDAAGNTSSLSNTVGTTTSDVVIAASQVLVFSKTTGFRHASIPTGIETLAALGTNNNFETTATEDANEFTEANLANYDLVVFLNTTGDVLNATQQTAFENYIRGGGAYMGIHSATDTEYDWPWYGQLAGAFFDNHPAIQEASIDVLDAAHPATAHLTSPWVRTDEWYNFRNISPDITVLLNLDESSYNGGENGSNHPIAWYQEFDGGRSFYTAGGHTMEAYAEPDFQQHLLGGILYCLNR